MLIANIESILVPTKANKINSDIAVIIAILAVFFFCALSIFEVNAMI